MITSTTSAIPAFTSGSSHISCAGSSSLIFSSTGNVGIGTINPSQRLTINTNGNVVMGNPSPSSRLDVQSEKIKELRVRFMDLLSKSILGGSIIDGSFMNDMIEIFDTCGGWNVDAHDDFKKLADLAVGRKIQRDAFSQFNDIIADRIINTWGFDLSEVGEIFEKIDPAENI